MTNPSVALSDDTARRLDVCTRYQRIAVGLKTAIVEAATEYLTPMATRRTIIRSLLNALPDDARDQITDLLVSTGGRIAFLDISHPAQPGLAAGLDALAAEAVAAVLPAIVAATTEHEQQTSGGAS